MNKRSRLWLLGALALLLGASNVLAIGRVAKRWYVFDMYGGYSKPVGTYDHIGFTDFTRDGQSVELDADRVYKDSYHFGISVGSLVANRFVTTFGFVYTKIEPLDRYWGSGDEYWEFDPFTPKFDQYDIYMSTAYHLLPLEQTGITPFVGLAGKSGLTRQHLPGVESEYDLNAALAITFGAELKIWQGANQSMLALVSANSYDLLASGYRPKYLNIGGGLRWYLRP